MSIEFFTNLTSGVGPVVLPPLIKFGCWRSEGPFRTGRWLTSYLVHPLGTRTNQRGSYLLKTVNRDLSEERQQMAIDRLARRVLLHDSVSHRCIPPVLDAELDAIPFFIVEPFVVGEALSKINWSCVERGSLSRRLWIARQIAEAIHTAHHRGQVHLGLSPHKILVDDVGQVAVLGWTSSQRFGQRCVLPCETLADVMARAPETFTADYRAQPAADVYSLGTVLYWLFSGTWPVPIGSTLKPPTRDKKGQASANFWELELAKIALAQQTCLPDPRPLAVSRIPEALKQLILRMLEKNAVARPGVGGVLDQLVAIEIDHLHEAGC